MGSFGEIKKNSNFFICHWILDSYRHLNGLQSLTFYLGHMPVGAFFYAMFLFYYPFRSPFPLINVETVLKVLCVDSPTGKGTLNIDGWGVGEE